MPGTAVPLCPFASSPFPCVPSSAAYADRATRDKMRPSASCLVSVVSGAGWLLIVPNERQFLILGASGFLGRQLFSALGPDRALATYHSTPIEHGVSFDAGSMRVKDVLSQVRGVRYAFVLYGIT